MQKLWKKIKSLRNFLSLIEKIKITLGLLIKLNSDN